MPELHSHISNCLLDNSIWSNEHLRLDISKPELLVISCNQLYWQLHHLVLMQPHSSKILAVSSTLFFLHTFHPDHQPPDGSFPSTAITLVQTSIIFCLLTGLPSAVYSQPGSLDDLIRTCHLVFHPFQSESQSPYWTISTACSCSVFPLRLHLLCSSRHSLYSTTLASLDFWNIPGTLLLQGICAYGTLFPECSALDNHIA